jgi:hypothetical protein
VLELQVYATLPGWAYISLSEKEKDFGNNDLGSPGLLFNSLPYLMVVLFGAENI